jgi:type IV pilus assembly protein PilC
MTYPKILSGLIVLVVAVIFGFVMPQFDSLFASMPVLPLPTRIMLAISDFVVAYWYALIIGAVTVFLLIYFLKKIPAVCYVLDRIQIHIPKIGKLFKVIYTARFARTLSSLYSSGIPIITCLDIASKTIGNLYIEKQFKQVIADTTAGESLSTAIGKVDGFVKKIESSIRVGEEAGSLDTMLDSIADDMEFESERAISQMVAYLEPAMIVVMAVIVGFIMISVIVPIYQSYQSIGAQ